MMTRKKIGKIQFWVGILLFLVMMISSVFIIKNVYIGSLVAGVEQTVATWSEVIEENEETVEGLNGQIVANVVLQGQIIKTTMFLYGLGVLIVVVLSVMLVLQGLANQSKK